MLRSILKTPKFSISRGIGMMATSMGPGEGPSYSSVKDPSAFTSHVPNICMDDEPRNL